MKTIAIQGCRGSFHDIAAHRYCQNLPINTLFCGSFEELFSRVSEDQDMEALIACENTIAGSLLRNYELLCASDMAIEGEYKLHIEHSLLCLPDENMEDLTEVNSHPVALMQCRNFLKAHRRLKVVEAEDTAGAAADIFQQQLRGHAAICHVDVAELYGMKVLAQSIEDNKHNYTRFLHLVHRDRLAKMERTKSATKASLAFTLPHEEGALSKVLSVFHCYKISLTKIQSLPIVGREWEYLFYVDMTFNDVSMFHQALDAVQPLTRELKHLGEYAEAL